MCQHAWIKHMIGCGDNLWCDSWLCIDSDLVCIRGTIIHLKVNEITWRLKKLPTDVNVPLNHKCTLIARYASSCMLSTVAVLAPDISNAFWLSSLMWSCLHLWCLIVGDLWVTGIGWDDLFILTVDLRKVTYKICTWCLTSTMMKKLTLNQKQLLWLQLLMYFVNVFIWYNLQTTGSYEWCLWTPDFVLHYVQFSCQASSNIHLWLGLWCSIN